MSLFANAKKVEAKTSARTKKVETVTVPGLSKFAALKAAIDSLTAMADVEEAEIKAFMAQHFVERGIDRKEKPDNFEGVDDYVVEKNVKGEMVKEVALSASASCQLKLRSSASALSTDDQALLMKNKIPFGEVVSKEEAFLINPAYTNDMALLSLVEEALSTVNLPSDFLLKQEREAKKVATTESIDAVFKLPADKAAEMLPLVTVLAIKPKVNDGDFWEVMDEIAG